VAIWLCNCIAAHEIILCSFAFVCECAYIHMVYVGICVNVRAFLRIRVINSVFVLAFHVLVCALYVCLCCGSGYACMHVSLRVSEGISSSVCVRVSVSVSEECSCEC
jgi:hypothetical protein